MRRTEREIQFLMIWNGWFLINLNIIALEINLKWRELIKQSELLFITRSIKEISQRGDDEILLPGQTHWHRMVVGNIESFQDAAHTFGSFAYLFSSREKPTIWLWSGIWWWAADSNHKRNTKCNERFRGYFVSSDISQTYLWNYSPNLLSPKHKRWPQDSVVKEDHTRDKREEKSKLIMIYFTWFGD